MWKIIAEKSDFVREVMSREDAAAFFAARGEELKVSRLGDIPEGETITIFRHGEFADLCRGPRDDRARDRAARRPRPDPHLSYNFV